MNWDDLRFVLQVARSGSITSASKDLRVAHTTVYRRIQAVEQTYGVQLFEKRGAAYDLTAVGSALVELASEMDERVSLLERQLGGQQGRVEGEVSITTVAALGERIGPHLIRFRQENPNVRLRLTVTDEMVQIARGDADVAIRITREPPERLVGRKVAAVDFAVFGHPGEGSLFERDWVCVDESRAHTPQARWEARHVPPERVVFRTNSRRVFLDAVAGGLGVGIIPTAIGHEDARLVPLSETLSDLTLPIWLLTHEELRATPRIRAVMDFFADVFKREQGRF